MSRECGEAHSSINLPKFSAGCSGRKHLGNGPASIVHVTFRERGMNEEHQTGFSQLLGRRQTCGGAKFGRKSFFEIDLAATSREAGYAFGGNRGENPVPGPSLTKLFRANKRVILVVRMTDVAWGLRHSQRLVLHESSSQYRRVPAPDFHHA